MSKSYLLLILTTAYPTTHGALRKSYLPLIETVILKY